MYKKIISFIIVCFFLLSNTLAFPTVYERTLDNLQVSEDIKITSSNRTNILNTPKVDETEKVYDFAELLTDNEEKNLYKDITNFISKTNLDMVIVIIDDNPKGSAMKYADDFYDYNYFGLGNTHDGILFLIDMDTREMWISTTGEAIRMYDDKRIDKILDSTYSKIKVEDYYGTASKFIERADYFFDLGIPSSNKDTYIDSNGDYISYAEDSYEGPKDIMDYISCASVAGVIAIIPALIIVFVMKSKHKTVKKATTAYSYMHNAKITYREDTFLTTNTTKVYDPPSESSSSSGGGSSTHRSSSGRSHGGGGRGF